MKSHSFISLLVACVAIAYGLGMVVGAKDDGSQSGNTLTVEPVALAPSVPVPAPAPVEAAAPVVPVTPEKVVQAEPVKPAPVAQPVAPSRPTSPVVSGLPTEAGMPPDDGKPIANAAGFVLPKAPKGWLPSPARGSDDPLVTVIIASDFQCPVCKRVVKPVEAMLKELGKDVRVEFKNHALESHPRAEDAAAASMAAHRQGKFWDMHDQLFMNQRALGVGDLEDHARKLGLDMVQWEKDFNDPAIRGQIRSNSKTAEALGARGTPGFFINGKKQVGWGSFFGFKGMVDRELKKAREAAANGKSRSDVLRERIQSNSEDGNLFIKHYLDGVPFDGV